MSLFGKVDRARQWQRERLGLNEESERKRRENERETISDELEKGDRFAIHFSAFTTLFLPAALLIAALGGFLLLIVHLL